MKSFLLLILAFYLFQSCIPLRIAPRINDFTITEGKKFKRGLSNRQMFIFEDVKDAEQFYDFVNFRFQLNDTNIYDDVPFVIHGQQYFFAWYEVEIPNKSIQILPILADVIVVSTGSHPVFFDSYGKRDGNWYLAIEVYNDIASDCLAETSLSRHDVLKYLRDLKKEYLATNNYNETVFKN